MPSTATGTGLPPSQLRELGRSFRTKSRLAPDDDGEVPQGWRPPFPRYFPW